MPQDYETLLVGDDEGVRTITLNRADKKNAFNIQQAVDLRDALADFQSDDEAKVLIVTGSGNAFSAGADMNTFAGKDTGDASQLPLIGALHEPMLAVEKPMLAAVNGLAVGMGVTLLPFFDMAYAGESATFRTPFVGLGIVLEYASSWTLPRLIGRQRTNELILRAKGIDAQTAYDWGLVNRVFPDADLLAEVTAIARDIVANGERAVRLSKQLTWGAADRSLREAYDAEQEVLATCYGSEEHMKQVMAFFQRKKG